MTAKASLFELYQNGLLSALDVMKVCLEGAENLRTRQLAAIRDAKSELERSCDEVKQAKDYEMLVALQSEIAGWEFQKVLGHWSGLAQAGSESQAEVLREVHRQLIEIRDRFRDTLYAATGGSETLVNSIQSMLTATSAAYALSVRAMEEAAKFGAAQAARADARSLTSPAASPRRSSALQESRG